MQKDTLKKSLNLIEAQEAHAIEEPRAFFDRSGVEETETPHVTIVRHFAGLRKGALVSAPANVVAELVADGVVTEDEANEAAAARAA